MKQKQSIWMIGGVFFFLLSYILDRILKIFFVQGFWEKDVSPFFDFSFHANPFLAFSIPFISPLVTLLAMLICVGVFSVLGARWWYQGFYFSGWCSFGIVLGALSNLYDRFFYGFVIDYISFLPGLGLPYFNIADAMIVGGIVGLFFRKQR